MSRFKCGFDCDGYSSGKRNPDDYFGEVHKSQYEGYSTYINKRDGLNGPYDVDSYSAGGILAYGVPIGACFLVAALSTGNLVLGGIGIISFIVGLWEIAWTTNDHLNEKGKKINWFGIRKYLDKN